MVDHADNSYSGDKISAREGCGCVRVGTVGLEWAKVLPENSLAQLPTHRCRRPLTADCDRDGAVNVAEVIPGFNNLLLGCPSAR